MKILQWFAFESNSKKGWFEIRLRKMTFQAMAVPTGQANNNLIVVNWQLAGHQQKFTQSH